MLTLLKIRNLALVDELHWELERGLIGVTGETGAGKSVIVGALKLILGERADKGLIRTGEEQCSVEAVFALGKNLEIERILSENGLPSEEGSDLIIRRVVGVQVNRQFINDSPVTLNLLKRVGEYLVDLHGPHDHQSLLSTERQMAMLDAFGRCEAQSKQYRSAWQLWRRLTQEREALMNAEVMSAREIDRLKHQIAEIDAAQLVGENEAELLQRYRRSQGSARLLEQSAQAVQVLNGEDASSVMARLVDLQRCLRDIEKLDPSMRDQLSGLENALMELRELESNLIAYGEELEIDPEEAAQLEDRINLLESLKRKYGSSIQEILSFRDDSMQRLDQVENKVSKLSALDEQLAEALRALDQIGLLLRQSREKAAPLLAERVAEQLRDLGFKQSAFEVTLRPLSEPALRGLDDCEFLFGPNPGEPMMPLRHVASSGEISRVMLAIKSALADQDATPLMVFDEIDANVGGEIASAVGRKMAVLGARHQVIAITHFPQVAAAANRHFVVEKQVLDGRTCSRLFPVQGEARIHELVRMLGGGGDSARALAKSLLNGES